MDGRRRRRGGGGGRECRKGRKEAEKRGKSMKRKGVGVRKNGGGERGGVCVRERPGVVVDVWCRCSESVAGGGIWVWLDDMIRFPCRGGVLV